MGKDDARALQSVQRLGHLLLRFVVQRARRLVEYEDLRLRRHGAGDHQALLLSAGNAALSLEDHSLHPHRHRADIVGNAGHFSGLPRLVQRQLRCGDHDVGIDIALEQAAVLRHGADAPPQRAEIQPRHVLAVVVDGALFRRFKAKQQPHERGFTAARRADDGNVFPRPDLQIHAVHYPGRGVRIAEADVGQFNAPGKPRDHLFIVRDLRLRFQDRLGHFQDRLDIRHRKDHGAERGECTHDRAVGGVERDVFRGGNACLYGEVIEQDRASKGNRRVDRAGDTQKERPVIDQLRRLGIGVCPACESALLRAGQLDLLHAGDQRIADAVVFCTCFHRLLVVLHLHDRRRDAHADRDDDDCDARPHQRRGIMKDLRKEQQTRQACQAGGKEVVHQQIAKLLDRVQAARQLAGGIPAEEGRRQTHHARHDSRLHR